MGQVMEEIIAKSKAAKAAKAQEREDDLDAIEALDAELNGLLETGALAQLFRPKGARHDRAARKTAADEQEEGEKDYDRIRRELAFESRAQVRSRPQSAALTISMSLACTCMDTHCQQYFAICCMRIVVKWPSTTVDQMQ